MGTIFFDQQLENSHFAHHFKKPPEKSKAPSDHLLWGDW